MEELTKQQIVLLTLFVSFVTSIATGIVTVSLMDQAPAGVTQTINRVVERTIERVVEPNAAAVVQTVQPATTQDVVAEATAKALKSVVRITRTPQRSETSVNEGFGIIVDATGKVATDKGVTIGSGTYHLVFPDGTIKDAQIIGAAQGSDIAFLTPVYEQGETVKTYTPVKFAAPALFKLGQATVMIGGLSDIEVHRSIVQTLGRPPTAATSTDVSVASITIDLDNRYSEMGSSLFNLSGEFMGIKTQSLAIETSNIFLPAHLVRKALDTTVIPVVATSTPESGDRD
jgi:S1-C subfamily serine protease